MMPVSSVIHYRLNTYIFSQLLLDEIWWLFSASWRRATKTHTTLTAGKKTVTSTYYRVKNEKRERARVYETICRPFPSTQAVLDQTDQTLNPIASTVRVMKDETDFSPWTVSVGKSVISKLNEKKENQTNFFRIWKKHDSCAVCIQCNFSTVKTFRNSRERYDNGVLFWARFSRQYAHWRCRQLRNAQRAYWAATDIERGRTVLFVFCEWLSGGF